jgi:prepilin-type N-terminal cleavage/methylation domain-containing protein
MRRGFTLVELSVASVITTVVALAVTGSLRAVSGAMRDQDRLAEGMSMLASSEARMADHLARARMILLQRDDQVLLWLPNEPFDASGENTELFDTIHADELAWWVMDSETGTLRLDIVRDRADRASHGLSTDWSSLRGALQAQDRLESRVVLRGLARGSFQVEDGDRCSVRRLRFDGALGADRGSQHVVLGGRLLHGQRHPDCP